MSLQSMGPGEIEHILSDPSISSSNDGFSIASGPSAFNSSTYLDSYFSNSKGLYCVIYEIMIIGIYHPNCGSPLCCILVLGLRRRE